MKCNNKYCMWNAFDQCCHEDAEAYDKATPNQLDCPVSLRADLQSQLYFLIEDYSELLKHRNFKELIGMRNFIERQRPNEAHH